MDQIFSKDNFRNTMLKAPLYYGIPLLKIQDWSYSGNCMSGSNFVRQQCSTIIVLPSL
ncbi:uncharacterized protein METZ01_LOCUS102311 [marine metagenome]|uniref:Uncharacterized protein n=1 Tax=marine metagenome TaxID=408172 RepID=A0A381WBZ1_9ZZZZ